MLTLTDEWIEPYNNQKFCHIQKKKFHDVDNSNDDNDVDSNDNSDGEKFDARKFHGNAAGLDVMMIVLMMYLKQKVSGQY